MHPMLNIAIQAARRAARIINRAALDLETVKIARKQRNDFVTEVDQAAEAAIIETLLGAYPGHAILAEESGHRPGKEAASIEAAEYVWIIDPLDGTTNFIHGMPQYAISIALAQRGVVTQGLVYDPNRDELFTATRGRGAFLNNRRIRVSSRARLEQALIGTGFPQSRLENLDEFMPLFRMLVERTAGVRRPGAASLDLAYTACARYDGFFELGLSPWDVAAGSLLVTEAGGLVGDFEGDSNYLFGQRIVAGNPKIFAALVQLIASARLPAVRAAAPAGPASGAGS
jgi:myo-inositol-1(or 4)-monophosphatase